MGSNRQVFRFIAKHYITGHRQRSLVHSFVCGHCTVQYIILYILSYTCIHVPFTILASIASVQNYANYFGQC